MKIVVMSDSHRDTETIEAITTRETDADAFFHCGDSELSPNDAVLDDVHIVQGNCDWGAAFEDTVVAKIEEDTVLMVHGHQHGVKQNLLQLKIAAEEVHATIVLYGHSHLYRAEIQDNILFVNPGSTSEPRGHREATYAVIEKGESITVTFYDPMNGSLVEEANFSIS